MDELLVLGLLVILVLDAIFLDVAYTLMLNNWLMDSLELVQLMVALMGARLASLLVEELLPALLLLVLKVLLVFVGEQGVLRFDMLRLLMEHSYLIIL